jgi:hypothetical protein
MPIAPKSVAVQGALTVAAAVALSLGTARSAQAQAPFSFTANDLVVSVEGDGSGTGSYTDNQAAPLTLYEYSLSGTSGAMLAGSLMLPQTSTPGGNYAVSGEYGSSSEGTLQLSGNGQYLTIMGYATNADAYNSTYDNGVTSSTALAQSPNTGVGGANVARVIALVGANGSVNSTTAITGVFNENNPRSVYTQNGTSFYISGQGNADDTGGVFYVSKLGATTATAITGQDTYSKSNGNYNQDTRDVQLVNGQLVVSVDTTEGNVKDGYNIDRVGTLGVAGNPPTTPLNAQPTALPGINGAITLSNGNGNTLNGSSGAAYLSPENFFYADATTLYVADSGDPKNGSTAGTGSLGGPGAGGLGDGGLQKWSLINGTWQLDYTLSAGLGLVANDDNTSTGHGVSGLLGLTGKVVNGYVELFATSYVMGDTDQTYLYGISDVLGDTQASQVSGETFTTLEAAPADTDFRGVAFAPVAPVPLPPSLPLLLGGGLAVFGLAARRTSTRRQTHLPPPR